MTSPADTIRAEIVAEARRWLGTPYRHQAALFGIGVDCIGLIRRVGEAVGGLVVTEARYRPFAGYSRSPNPRRMGAGLAAFFDEIPFADADDGDVFWMSWAPQAPPMHTAIAATWNGERTIVHAAEPYGRVVEHRLDEGRVGLIVKAFRYPRLQEVLRRA